MEERKKTQVADMDRGVYDIKNEFEYSYISDAGLTEDIIREIWSNKNEPEWMLEFRLKSFETFKKMPMQTWGADLSEIDFDDLIYYQKPSDKPARSWDEVPEKIKETFERIVRITGENLEKYLAGEKDKMRNQVDVKTGNRK